MSTDFGLRKLTVTPRITGSKAGVQDANKLNMKTVSKVTREEEVFTCDFCGKVVPFYTKECYGCGKGCCNEDCNYLKMLDYPGGHPAELSSMRNHHGTGIYLPEIHFCLECDKSSKVAKNLRGIVSLGVQIAKQYSEYRRAHHKLAAAVDHEISQREKNSK